MPITNTPQGSAQNCISFLAVIPREEDCRSLRNILDHSNWTMHTAATVAEALSRLEDCPAPVILSEQQLPDGNWKDLLEAFAESENPPHLVVTSWRADNRLWAEVLNLGGFDVLPKPFDATEVFRVLSMAWRQWHDRASIRDHAPLALAAC